MQSVRFGRNGSSRVNSTPLVDVVHSSVNIFQCQDFRTVALSDRTAAFTQYDQFMAGDVVFLDCFANDLLRYPIAVYICRVPLILSQQICNELTMVYAHSVQTPIESCFQEWKSLRAFSIDY